MKRKSAPASGRDQLAAVVGSRLRSARAKIGMTRKQLAITSGTSERYLAHLEGGVGNPSLQVVKALAEALDMAMIELLPQGGERDANYAQAAELLRRLPEKQLPAYFAWINKLQPNAGKKGRRLSLVGLRGAGKTGLGEALAERLKVPFIEMSRQVEEAYGAEIGLLIEVGGQAAYRRYEALAWSAIVKDNPAAVIALPGGIVANTALYNEVLATSHTIWLEASPEDHMKRVMAQGDFRPMSGTRGAMNDLKTILQARTNDYSRAEARLNTSRQDLKATLGLLSDVSKSLLAREV